MDQRELLKAFFKWLHTNTDTFDPTMVKILIDDQDMIGFNDEDQAKMVDQFLDTLHSFQAVEQGG